MYIFHLGAAARAASPKNGIQHHYERLSLHGFVLTLKCSKFQLPKTKRQLRFFHHVRPPPFLCLKAAYGVGLIVMGILQCPYLDYKFSHFFLYLGMRKHFLTVNLHVGSRIARTSGRRA